AAHNIPYAATASIAFPEDMMKKVEKAKKIKGTRFLHVFASCPTGWQIPSEISIKTARQAVQTRIFPLYEVFDGVSWIINRMPDKIPVDEYFKSQGRFKHLAEEDLRVIQGMVDDNWKLLTQKADIANQAV
ncbi:MAG: pyruvate synthase subunit beta, partial [Desulfosarcina sp.]|nr:pyruvate synthase subunit beta [Desulfobacterales bacterium]